MNKKPPKSIVAILVLLIALTLVVLIGVFTRPAPVDAAVPESASTTDEAMSNISEPHMPIEEVFTPYGARICGWCSGCGEFHFIWDYHYIYDDCCDNTHGHCHSFDGCCDAGLGRECCDGFCC